MLSKNLHCLLVWVVALVGWETAAASHLDRVLILSGVDSQLDQVPEQYKRGLGPGLPGVTSEIRIGIDAAVDEVLDPETLRSGLRDYLDGSMPDRTLRRLLRWYASDLGAKITRLEIERGSGDDLEQMNAMADSLLADDALMARIRALDEVVGATDHATEMARVTQLAIMTGMIAASAQDVQIEEGELQQIVDQMVTAGKASMDRYVLASMAYTYRPLAAEEFERYVRFLARRDSRKFSALLQQALLAEMERATRALGRRVGEIIAAAVVATDELPTLAGDTTNL